MANVLLILNWSVFYILHSALASGKIKRFLKANWPKFYKNYRIFYSLLSALLISGIFIQALFLPVRHLWDPMGFSSYSGYMLTTLGVVVIIRSIKAISFWRFLVQDEKMESPLIQKGMYNRVRHPLYLGLTLVFLGYFLVAGTTGSLIHLACLILYLPFGIYFEERKLLALYGETYKKYKDQVPAFFPKWK
jgi:methanethiol S-methyltransferase